MGSLATRVPAPLTHLFYFWMHPVSILSKCSQMYPGDIVLFIFQKNFQPQKRPPRCFLSKIVKFIFDDLFSVHSKEPQETQVPNRLNRGLGVHQRTHAHKTHQPARAYTITDTPDNIMLVMEYIEWGNLLDYVLEYDPIPEPSVRHLFQQLICGVEHIHYLRCAVLLEEGKKRAKHIGWEQRFLILFL